MTSITGTGLIRAQRNPLNYGGLFSLLAAAMILATINVGQALGATLAPTATATPDAATPAPLETFQYSYQFYEDALTDAAVEIESARDRNVPGCVMIVTHPLPTGESVRDYADRYDLRGC